MLPARIEAPADLDVKISNGFVERKQAIGKPRADFTGQAARRGDAEFARVRAWARDDVENGSGAGLIQADGGKLSIQIRKIGFDDPSQDDVLFDRRAKCVRTVAPRNVRELS